MKALITASLVALAGSSAMAQSGDHQANIIIYGYDINGGQVLMKTTPTSVGECFAEVGSFIQDLYDDNVINSNDLNINYDYYSYDDFYVTIRFAEVFDGNIKEMRLRCDSK